MNTEEIASRTIRSVIALTSRSLFLQITSAVTLTILGGLLLPGEIGVFIVVSSIMRIFSFFTDLGLGAALIQRKNEIDEKDLANVFTLQIILVGIVVAGGLFLTPWVRTYSSLSSEATFLYQVLIVTILISSLKMIPSVMMERKLAFEKQVLPQIVESLVFNVMVVLLAYNNFGIASYSWSILVSALVGLPIYYLLSPWRPAVGFDKDRAAGLIRYGLPFQSKSILAILKDDLLTFFLSGFPHIGASGIGYWGFAQRFAYYPFRLVVDSVTKVTFPAYSRLQDNKTLLRSGIEKSLFAVSSLVFPILTIMSVSAWPLVNLIPRYHKWIPALPSFYFLCAGAAISALSNILINALDATGKVKTTLSLMVFWIVLIWVLTLSLTDKIGFTGIAVASFFVSLTIVLTVFLLKRHVKFNFLAHVLPAAVASFLLGSANYIMLMVLPATFFSIIFSALVGGIIYLLTMNLLIGAALRKDISAILKSYGFKKT